MALARKATWAETLVQFENLAAIPLGWPKWPFFYYTREVEGLWKRAGTPARVRGFFKMTLEYDPAMKDFGTSMRAFVFAHEIAHMKHRHPLILAVFTILSLGILYLPTARYLEWAADREVTRWLPPHLFLSCARTVAHQRSWASPITNSVYPAPLERMANAYCMKLEEAERWAHLDSATWAE